MRSPSPLILCLLALLGCASEPKPRAVDPESGEPRQSSFVSADAVAGESAGEAEGVGGLAANAAADGAATGSGEARSVMEGDIYRVLDTGTILNLNSYRGLQVIDVADPTEPAIVGSYSVQGQPVEMYVTGERALLLLNHWQGYYGTRDDVAVQQREGGLVVAVGHKDPPDPREIDRVFVEGYIMKSRVVSGETMGALYVASTESREVEDPNGGASWVDRTVVTSFDIGGDRLARKGTLDLGGYVSDIQATPEALLVASQDWTQDNSRSDVALVDISDPNGQMVMGDVVRVSGYVESQFNMDLYNGVLRVVSGNNWTAQTNQVETFDARDLHALQPLDSCTFGDGMQLFATLFLGNKAFFVTYLRQDPFHAFEIADDGTCVEHSEFVVSGWNDFFRPVEAGSRLIGIGQDDADQTRSVAVSLYDITSLTNANPLLARARGPELDWSWSEASFDHRAFSVLEGAVSVQAADGTTETGLVLLPFSGYSDTAAPSGQYQTGVQLFTFSATTVTARATLSHDSDVRRAFLTREDVSAALSETSLSLFDHGDPDAPKLLSELELAPDYARVLVFGDYVARLKRVGSYWDAELRDVPNARVEIVAADSALDSAPALASFEVPANTSLLKTGDLLVSIAYRVRGDQEKYPYDYTTTVTLYDLSDPLRPEKRGEAQTDDLTPSYLGGYYYGYAEGPAIGCGFGDYWFSGNQTEGTFALGDVLVFTTAEQHQKTEGRERVCSYYPRNNECQTGTCERVLMGGRDCTSLDGGTEVCRGEFAECALDDWSVTSCQPVELAEIEDELMEDCWTNDRIRYWSSYDFKPLDISDPEAPLFRDTLEMPDADEAVRVLPFDTSIYYTYKVPVPAEDDPRPHTAYYFKQIDFADAADPAVSAKVNIPGELIAVEGGRLYTKDLLWGEERAETVLHALSLEDGVAYLDHSKRFAGREVSNVVASDGNLLVSHQPTYGYWYPRVGEVEDTTQLTILAQADLSLQSEVDVDSWSTFEAAHGGRALYTVPGGLMLLNVEDPERPHAQAFFHSNGWPEQILFEGGKILVAAGNYGIHQFDATEFNLLAD